MNKIETIEKSFVMIKPDGVARGLVGKIFQRFEEMGLKLVAARMINATEDKIRKHYPYTDEWLRGIGKKSLKVYKGDKDTLKDDYGTDDMREIGEIVHENLVEYLRETPVIISVWEGNHAIERVRKLVGMAMPTFAEVGTLRGMYAFDTQPLAVRSGRITFKNIIHASDSVDESDREIKIWFGDKFKNLAEYERVDYVDIF